MRWLVRAGLGAALAMGLVPPASAEPLEDVRIEPGLPGDVLIGSGRCFCDSVFDGDYAVVVAGAGALPAYPGASHYRAIPFVQAEGELSGHDFYFHREGLQLQVSVLPTRDDEHWQVETGPLIGWQLGRTSHVRNARVKKLRRARGALQVGGFVGVTRTGVLTSRFDRLTIEVDVAPSVTGRRRGVVISPQFNYRMPMSARMLLMFSGGLDFATAKFMRKYFEVTPAGSAASGLRRYRPRGGLKSGQFSTTLGYALNHDLRKRGAWMLFLSASYERLAARARRSPIAHAGGSANQWFGGAGMGYTF